MSKKSSSQKSSTKPLARSVREAWTLYRTSLRAILTATFIPLALIVLLRWLTDDYTGNQYSAVIALISVFNTMLLARLVTVGWDRKSVKLLAYYNGVMSRYLSGVGLICIMLAHALPLLAGVLLFGLVGVEQLPLPWLILIIPLCVIGVGVALHASFALFTLTDDMSLSVLQSLRVSGRLTRRYYRPLLARVAGLIAFFIALGAILIVAGSVIAPYIQSAQVQLFIDVVLSWLFTPALFCYGATLYRKLLEAHE